MCLSESGGAAKPFKYRRALDARRLARKYSMIRGVGPVATVIYETMFLRVTVDVSDQCGKVPIAVDQSTLEGTLKQATRPIVRLVEGLGVGYEQTIELPTDIQDWSNLRDWTSLGLLDAHQEVKMVVQKTVGIGFSNGLNVLGP